MAIEMCVLVSTKLNPSVHSAIQWLQQNNKTRKSKINNKTYEMNETRLTRMSFESSDRRILILVRSIAVDVVGPCGWMSGRQQAKLGDLKDIEPKRIH